MSDRKSEKAGTGCGHGPSGEGIGPGSDSGSGSGSGAGPEGPLARDALATPVRPPLPPPPAAGFSADVLPDPGALFEVPELPGAPDRSTLTFLTANAALRARDLLARYGTEGTDGADEGPESEEADGTDGSTPSGDALWRDAVRLAAAHPHLTGRAIFSSRFARLARATGHTAQDLTRAAAAWRQGGEVGLSVLESPWDPPAGNFDRARGALASADLPRMSPHRNRLTDSAGVRQLRYGRDGRWYPYRKGPSGDDDWWPEGPADVHPAVALRGAFSLP